MRHMKGTTHAQALTYTTKYLVDDLPTQALTLCSTSHSVANGGLSQLWNEVKKHVLFKNGNSSSIKTREGAVTHWRCVSAVVC